MEEDDSDTASEVSDLPADEERLQEQENTAKVQEAAPADDDAGDSEVADSEAVDASDSKGAESKSESGVNSDTKSSKDKSDLVSCTKADKTPRVIRDNKMSEDSYSESDTNASKNRESKISREKCAEDSYSEDSRGKCDSVSERSSGVTRQESEESSTSSSYSSSTSSYASSTPSPGPAPACPSPLANCPSSRQSLSQAEERPAKLLSDTPTQVPTANQVTETEEEEDSENLDTVKDIAPKTSSRSVDMRMFRKASLEDSGFESFQQSSVEREEESGDEDDVIFKSAPGRYPSKEEEDSVFGRAERARAAARACRETARQLGVPAQVSSCSAHSVTGMNCVCIMPWPQNVLLASTNVSGPFVQLGTSSKPHLVSRAARAS